MALVSQEPVLFARSVKRNIIYGLEQEDGAPVTPGQVRLCSSTGGGPGSARACLGPRQFALVSRVALPLARAAVF
jgi:hypothetical protein